MYELPWTTLVDPGTLADALAAGNNVNLIDCRARLGDLAYGDRAYGESRLPGAVRLDLDRDLASPPGDGGRHPLPDPDALCARLRALGLDDDQQLVCYDDAGGAFAARAWWCLRWLGHEAVAVLDGGWQHWQGAKETGPPGPVTTGRFSRRPALTRQIDAAGLAAELGGPTLLDARSEARYAGREEPIDPVAGHIPGARCRPFDGNLTADGRFRPAGDLAARFAGLGDDLVCYCGSGVTAAHNVLALRRAGLPEPRLYPGSWSEWIRDPARPQASGETP